MTPAMPAALVMTGTVPQSQSHTPALPHPVFTRHLREIQVPGMTHNRLTVIMTAACVRVFLPFTGRNIVGEIPGIHISHPRTLASMIRSVYGECQTFLLPPLPLPAFQGPAGMRTGGFSSFFAVVPFAVAPFFGVSLSFTFSSSRFSRRI